MLATLRGFSLPVDAGRMAWEIGGMTQDISAKSCFFPVLLWLGAFVCALYPVNALQMEFFMAATILVFVWTILMLFRKADTGWVLPRSMVLRLAGLFWGLVIVSAFWSEVIPVSLVAICFFSLFPLTFYGGILGGSEAYFSRLVRPLAVLFAVMSLWAVFQYFFLNSYFMGQARHPLADPSSLGALFSLALFAALGWMVSDRPKSERRVALVLSCLLACGMLSTIARGPMFALVPGLALFVMLLWPQVKASRRSFMIILVVVAGYYALMQTGVGADYDIGKRMLQTIAEPGGEATKNRMNVWGGVIAMIKDEPWLGRGFGTFFLYYPEFRLPQETDGVYLAHNDPMQFWAELGILGPVLFYLFVVAASLRSFAALGKLPKGHTDRVIIVTTLAALAAMVVHTHVSFNFYNLSILLLAGLLLSVWFAATRRALSDESVVLVALPDSLPHNAGKALIVLPFVMMGWLFLSIAGGEHLAGKARDALFRQDMDRFLVYINKAGHVSMHLNYRAYLLAVNVPMAILEDRKSTLNEDQQKKLYDQISGYMEDVLAVNPRASSAYYYLARVQSMVEPSVIPPGTASPREYYERAIRFDPMHLGVRLALLDLYEKDGMSATDRIAFMEKAVQFNYATEKVLDFYAALSRLYLEVGDYEKVKGVMAKTRAFQERSAYSLKRQNTSIPQAIMGGDALLEQP